MARREGKIIFSCNINGITIVAQYTLHCTQNKNYETH